MACRSCDSGDGFRAHYCEDCGRWSIHANQRHLLIGAGIVAAATVVVAIAIVQPELAPLLAGAGVLLRRTLTARV